MPVPDFSPGEVLTAQAMDSIGLWLVKTQTIGTGVSSVTVTNAFSANYDNYRVIINTAIAGTGGSSFITLSGATGSTYNSSGSFATYVATQTDITTLGNTNQGLWMGIYDGNYSASIDIMKPFLSSATNYNGMSSTNGYANTFRGLQYSAISSVSFTFLTPSTTMTGGTIKVYGYRN